MNELWIYTGQTKDTGALGFTTDLIKANRNFIPPFEAYIHNKDHITALEKANERIKELEAKDKRITELEAKVVIWYNAAKYAQDQFDILDTYKNTLESQLQKSQQQNKIMRKALDFMTGPIEFPDAMGEMNMRAYCFKTIAQVDAFEKVGEL